MTKNKLLMKKLKDEISDRVAINTAIILIDKMTPAEREAASKDLTDFDKLTDEDKRAELENENENNEAGQEQANEQGKPGEKRRTGKNPYTGAF